MSEVPYPSRKVEYASLHQARIALIRLRKMKWYIYRRERRAYLCPHCMNWHLAHK